MSQNVPQTSKFPGFCNRSSQVPGHPEVAYEFPAQSPQNVMSTGTALETGTVSTAGPSPKMMDMLMKNLLSGLQFVGSSFAEGTPQLDGFGAPARISWGIAAR